MTSSGDNPNTNSENGVDSVVVISAVVATVAALIIIAIVTLWCYRRKTGNWPKPCRRTERPPIHANPYGIKSYATRWKDVAGSSNPVVVGHQTDYRIPTPQNNKKVYSINERIADHLHEASEKLTKDNDKARNTDSSVGRSGVTKKMSRSKSYDDYGTSEARAAALHRTVHSHSGEIGIYQDRTLPATLMMTSESKRRKFANEDTALKRSNSATPRSSANSKSSNNVSLSRHPESNSMQIYNDFGPKASAGQYRAKRNARRTSNLSSFVSSKPSNTSDYISDFDSMSRVEKLRLNQNKFASQSQMFNSRVSECDSVLQESIANDNYESYKDFEQANFRPHVPPLALYRAEVDVDLESEVFFDQKKNRFVDDRTESQQNTMRSEAFQNYSFVYDEERSCAEGQSSDTESMTGSVSVATIDRKESKTFRRCQSDNEILDQTSSRNKTRRKKRRPNHRSTSNGCESEPDRSVAQYRTKKRTATRSLSRNGQTRKEDQSQFASKPRLGDSISSQSKVRSSKLIKAEKRGKNQMNKQGSLKPYNSASLKPPVIGTLVEMPIYSQATWSGPESPRKQSQFLKKPAIQNFSGGSMSRVKKMQKSKKSVRTGRKLSIGGGGRYFCEYGSLPIDLSKLPKDLIAKIGQPDQLLEPIEKLNFEKLCKPLPHLGTIEGQSSARRLIIDRLPPNHHDREVLSNTYEYEGTGLVMTDL